MGSSGISRLRRISAVSVPVLAIAALGLPAVAAQAATGPTARLVGTSTATTGAFTPSGTNDVTDEEFMGEPDDAENDGGPPAFTGTITDRSLSNGHGNGAGPSANSGPKAKSNPQLGPRSRG